MRLALKVAMQNDGDFMDVILPYFIKPITKPSTAQNTTPVQSTPQRRGIDNPKRNNNVFHHSWKPLTKRSQGRPKHTWEDNIKQDICQIKIKNWIACVQDRGK